MCECSGDGIPKSLFRYRLTRESDGKLIALSEAIKCIPA